MTQVPAQPAIDVAVVVIGRNEGERLRACLDSVAATARLVVYVDSGSTDDSVQMARRSGAQVIELDMSVPFTAARARNVGWRRAHELAPSLHLVQFVDGDCAVARGWLEQAQGFLDQHPEVAAVCGRRRERDPERSVYNLLCDLEWDTPVGQTKACGGDVMMRLQALQAAGGYRDSLIAGEEPELCVRLRGAGWRIWRLGAEMTVHDAAMTRFSQWWKRGMRTGFTYAEGSRLHGAPPERHRVRESRSAWFWGLALPIAVLAAALVISPWFAAGLLLYPLQMLRLFTRFTGPARHRALKAVFIVLGKFAEVAGQFKYLALRCSGGQAHLIEYK